jgi:hypothetical protein
VYQLYSAATRIVIVVGEVMGEEIVSRIHATPVNGTTGLDFVMMHVLLE